MSINVAIPEWTGNRLTNGAFLAYSEKVLWLSIFYRLPSTIYQLNMI